jgi:FkbM family methyltransferase
VLQRIINRGRSLNKWRRSAGLSTGVRLKLLSLRKKLGLPEPATWHVHPRQVRHALTARLGNSSDMFVFDQIFINDEYSCLKDLKDPLLVLDLGANVGFSSAYFLSLFPCSRVTAVEPDDRNIAMCRTNLSSYGERVLLLHGAVWAVPTRLCLSKGAFGDGREWATQVFEPTAGMEAQTRAWDVASLIEMSGGGIVDLLKVDIEGAEQSVFGEAAKAWLPRVRNICIELHGKDCEEAFFAALAGYCYDLEHSGELTICRNICPKSRRAS